MQNKEYYTNKQGNIIVQLGGMQITRKTLDNIKFDLGSESDEDAVNYLIQIAEHAFSKFTEKYED